MIIKRWISSDLFSPWHKPNKFGFCSWLNENVARRVVKLKMIRKRSYKIFGGSVSTENWFLILYMAVNTVFMAKYTMRVTSLWPLAAVVFILFQYFVFRFVLPIFDSKGGEHGHGWIRVIKVGAVACVAIMFATQLFIDPFSVNVDRWSALHYPISYLLDGKYPYSAPTHLGGRASPFPVWQIIHIPFYWCNNVGLSFFAALALFIWSIRRVVSTSAAWKSIVLVTVSVPFYYEAAVRSDLMANFLLLASAILLIKPYLSYEWVDRYYIPLSIVTGLFASTRLLALLPLVILFIPYYMRLKPYKMVLIPIVVCLVFVATFVPIVLLDCHEFFYGQYPPWLLQTSQGSALDFFVYIPVILWFSLIWRKSFNKYCFLTAVYLVLFVSVSFVHRMVESGEYNLFSHAYDITYFSTALPFIILGFTVADRNTNLGLAKIQ